jgi:hypothetical protein
VAEDQRLHVAAEFVAIVLEIFSVHAREDCNRKRGRGASGEGRRESKTRVSDIVCAVVEITLHVA